mmetsp:Transcript_3160/g.5764  ORF Transcript_3160/g.5764 Transcript_3160/m.5764 type:complete len:510 (+) Transcript_3160:97-1626(+)
MASERNRDEEHREAFEEVIGISQSCKDEINMIKNNDSDLEEFSLENVYAAPGDVDYFSDLAWELLGRYIADNHHLYRIDLSFLHSHLTDENMTHLFKKLTRSRSLKKMDLLCNEFGLSGIQSMVPLLKNAQSLTKLDIGGNDNINNECFRILLGGNDNINSECFRLIVEALHGGSIEQVHFGDCNIDDIMALEYCTLPNLRFLDLDSNNIQSIPSLEKYTNLEQLWLMGNNIGKEGCRSIAKLLQNESLGLRHLYLDSNDIGDEEAEILANALKHNTKLADLSLGNNKIKEKGCRAFLKLLNDVSSIERTYNSKHTLTILRLPYLTDSKFTEMTERIASAIKTNAENRENSDAGRAKVIKTQLNSNTRKEFSLLQGIDYAYSSLFTEIDSVLLPDVLALKGETFGQNELYRMLVATAPDLASVVNRKGVLEQKMAENTARIAAINTECVRQVAALSAENLRQTAALDAKTRRKELESIETGGVKQSMVDASLSSIAKLRGKKRGISPSI